MPVSADTLRRALPAAALALLIAVPLAAHSNARFYRGDIVASGTWDGVIRITGTVVIREGVTVSVDPGTEVLVQPGTTVDIVVRGRFFVRGVPGKPVLFDTAGGCRAGRWGGILFEPGSAGIFENSSVRCSSTGVRGDLSRVALRGLEIR